MEWDDLKNVDDVLYPTYRDACYARGLLQDDKEYIDGILEASLWGMATIYLELLDIQRKNICLSYIECMLGSNNRSLKDIHNMPYRDQEYTMDGYNRLIYDETSYNKDQLREQHVKLYGSLTTEQKGIYSTGMDAVDNNKGGMFFVYGYDGTGKTYLYKTMSAVLRFKGDIVLNVVSGSIAALLLIGGRTTHSRFAIPINVVEDSMCHIAADSDIADLIRKENLIIWDEAPMINRHCYEAFDRALRDICRTDPSVASDKVFGGKVVLFGGDFRQIIPVITNGGRQDVVNATINSSYPLQEKVEQMSADVARGHGGDGGSDDRPPPYQAPTGCGGCLGNRGTRHETPNLRLQETHKGRLHTRQETRNLGLKAITDKNGPVPIRFEFGDRETLMPLGEHAAHWANYLGELVRELPLYYPSWRQMPPERKAGVVEKIGAPTPRVVCLSPKMSIMALFEGQQLGDTFPGVGDWILPGRGTVIPPSPPCTHSSDVAMLKKREKTLTKQVNMFMKIFRSDDKFSQMLTQLESHPEYGGGSGSGGCEDDDPVDDEDGGEDGEDEDDS
ncbi:ATP-dependent DNA helicase RRM3-like protein [Tanacetum coccineum]|uniref:ATP-dependent DNA helicase n=1 Tax=Tanacetum coccineum TaxID=301880 RepID=A0ABQ5EJ57_9ASTR